MIYYQRTHGEIMHSSKVVATVSYDPITGIVTNADTGERLSYSKSDCDYFVSIGLWKIKE